MKTRDGEKIGNAIVIKFDEEKQAWLIQTDYGSKVMFTEEQINESFKLGAIVPITEWRATQMSKIFKGSPWPQLAKSENRDIAQKVFAEMVKEHMEAQEEAARRIRLAKQEAHKQRQLAKKNQTPPNNKPTKNKISGNGKTKPPERELKIPAGGNIFDAVFKKK